LHILRNGAHPIFFYGQNYMGALEAYLGAAAFKVFGVSVVSLRLGVLLLYALFLASTYLLAALLYDRRVALVSVVVLGLGTHEILFRQLEAAGGYSETLAFGSLAVLLASWLAWSYAPDLSVTERHRRWAAYAAWGLVVGLGLWSDVLVLPYLLAAGAILLLFCRSELRTWALALLAAGFTLGALPLIAYNLAPPGGQNSLVVFLQLRGAGGTGRSGAGVALAQQFVGTLLVSVPAITGANPLCPVNGQTAWPLTATSSGQTVVCTTVHGVWGVGVLALAALGGLAALALLRRTLGGHPRAWRKAFAALPGVERRASVLAACRLALLVGAALTLATYATSPAPGLDPWTTARYLLPLLIAAPVALAPLVGAGMSSWPRLLAWKDARLWRVGRYAVLAGVCAVLLLGMIQAFGVTPAAQAHNAQFAALQADLERAGAAHLYTDYWTCDRIAFQSQERITCSVLGNDLTPGLNRYPAYARIVAADPRAAYVFADGSPQALALAAGVNGSMRQYHRLEMDGYVVYLFQQAPPHP
ncbi:MAG: ArnT family glycosyltransferase, partial [Ktedonobacterales bacterium]